MNKFNKIRLKGEGSLPWDRRKHEARTAHVDPRRKRKFFRGRRAEVDLCAALLKEQGTEENRIEACKRVHPTSVCVMSSMTHGQGLWCTKCGIAQFDKPSGGLTFSS